MSKRGRAGGFTLIELSVVIFVLIALMTGGLFYSSAINDWRRGRDAADILRAAHVAQRMYLADYPTTPVSSLTRSMLLPYLPNAPATFPQVLGLDGQLRNVRVNVSPPVVVNANGTTYDPSGKPNDSLWDVGE